MSGEAVAWPQGAAASAGGLQATPSLRTALYVLGAVLLACIPGFVLFGPSPDLENYRILYEDWNFIDLAEQLQGNDPIYFLLMKLSYDAGVSFRGFLLLLALLTCGVQARLLSLLDTRRGLLLVLYLSYLFWLHDYTQIRFSLALALVLLAIYQPGGLKRVLLFALGLGVHASVALIALLWALWRYPRAALVLLVLSVPALLASGQIDNLVVNVALRLATYIDQRDVGLFDEINLFSLMPMTQAAMTLLCMLRGGAGSPAARQETYFAWAGLAGFYAFSFLPVLAFRTYEMMIPFFLILVARNWSRDGWARWPLRALGVVYILLGLRVSFFSADSVLRLF